MTQSVADKPQSVQSAATMGTNSEDRLRGHHNPSRKWPPPPPPPTPPPKQSVSSKRPRIPPPPPPRREISSQNEERAVHWRPPPPPRQPLSLLTNRNQLVHKDVSTRHLQTQPRSLLYRPPPPPPQRPRESGSGKKTVVYPRTESVVDASTSLGKNDRTHQSQLSNKHVSDVRYPSSVAEKLQLSLSEDLQPRSSEPPLLQHRSDPFVSQSLILPVERESTPTETTENDSYPRNKAVLRRKLEQNGDQSASVDQSKLLMKTLSYLLLCMSSSSLSALSIGHSTNTAAEWSIMLATCPVWWLTSTKVREIVDSESLRIDQSRRQSVSVPKQRKARKHRIRRKCKRWMARPSYLTEFVNLERDLSDKEFKSLLSSLSQSPLELVDHEEVIVVEEKVSPRVSYIDFLPLPASAMWQDTPDMLEEELLSDFEEKLLRESTDEWIASHAFQGTGLDTEESDDDLTEVDLWILRDAACMENELPTSSERSDGERKEESQLHDGAGQVTRKPLNHALEDAGRQANPSHVRPHTMMNIGESSSGSPVIQPHFTNSRRTRTMSARQDRPPLGFQYVRDD